MKSSYLHCKYTRIKKNQQGCLKVKTYQRQLFERRPGHGSNLIGEFNYKACFSTTFKTPSKKGNITFQSETYKDDRHIQIKHKQEKKNIT